MLPRRQDFATRPAALSARRAGFALALILGALTITGCAVSEPASARRDGGPIRSAELPRGTVITLLEARTLACEKPEQRAIQLLERAAFRFPLSDANLRYLAQDPVAPEVRSYLERRFEAGRNARIEREPLTPRVNRFSRPKSWPYGPYYEPSPQSP